MKRACLALVACALAAASARPARADEPPGPTLAGVQVALAGGARFATPNDAVDHELTRAGWSRLPTFVPDAQIRCGLSFYDVSVDMHFAGIDAGFAGPPGTTASGELHREAIGVDFGTRARLGHGLVLAPLIGIGGLKTNLCFDAAPSARSALGSSPFSQVVRNPGQGTCLAATAPVLDIGLAIPLTLRSWRDRSQPDMVLVQGLSVGPKFGYSFRIDGGRTWSADSGLPKFQGPTAPIGGAYAGIEAQYTFGVARGGGSSR